MEQQIHFCTARDGVRLAWAVSGSGTPLVKAAHWLTHVDRDWDSPIWRHQHQGLSNHYRLLRYDQRGTGLSDREMGKAGLELWVDDLESVVDAAGFEHFVLLGMSQGGPIAMEFAKRHPDRVSHLVIYGSYLRGRRHWQTADDSRAESAALVDLIRVGWARQNPAFRQVFASLFIPEANPEQMREFNELQRHSTSNENAARIVEIIDSLDETMTAKEISVPTLVLHCTGDARVPFDEGRRLASAIAGSRFVPLEGNNHIMLEGEVAWDEFIRSIREFTGAGGGDGMMPPGGFDPAALASLTERERAVLELLATGRDTASIAGELFLAPKTVRNYLSRIFDKLGVANRSAAIVLAREHGLGGTRR